MKNQKNQKNQKNKIRSHKILGIPVLGLIIGGFLAFGISHIIIGGLFGIPIDIMMSRVPLDSLVNGGQLDKSLLHQMIGSGYFTASALGGILMIFIHKFWFRGEFKGCYTGNWGDKQTKTLILIGIIALGLNIILGYVTSGIQLPTYSGISTSLMAGIGEEVAFRLIPISLGLRKAVNKKAIYTVLIVSSIMFGCSHLSNLAEGQALGYTLLQVVFTLGVGVFLGAIYIRTGNLLITIIFHVVYDFLVLLAGNVSGRATIIDYLMLFAIIVLLTVAGMLMLKGKTEDIKGIWQDRWNFQAA